MQLREGCYIPVHIDTSTPLSWTDVLPVLVPDSRHELRMCALCDKTLTRDGRAPKCKRIHRDSARGLYRSPVAKVCLNLQRANVRDEGADAYEVLEP